MNQQLPRPLITGWMLERINELPARFPARLIVVDSREEILSLIESARPIKAGAHLVVGDFTQWRSLLACLSGEND